MCVWQGGGERIQKLTPPTKTTFEVNMNGFCFVSKCLFKINLSDKSAVEFNFEHLTGNPNAVIKDVLKILFFWWKIQGGKKIMFSNQL